ncbi:uncharacterized protein K444DRAFT_666843 [Hyaloscypha bicolor E]|uniref:Uncharacterized protein n=1 Tax=Hyaloscypha bicolor E TaxID=1095630 RepID=A0A2J6SVU5_9HELO|nr:uncharacterized protein K444DRAFT_666843 [Hyaloscypha bicolor E]PMD54887.1 hypothetical protein K444DRAFT_666843 [Hyaloscypha bicolor E]
MDALGSAKFQFSHTPDNLACFDARWESYIEQGPAAIPYLLEWGKFTMLRSLWYEADGDNAYIECFFPDCIANTLKLYAKETLEELALLLGPIGRLWRSGRRWLMSGRLRAGTEPFAGRASEDIVCQVSDGRKRGELKNLNEVVLRNLDERDDDKVATVDVVKSDCEETCIMVELKEVSGKVSFHEEMRSLVERPAICANYPRKED